MKTTVRTDGGHVAEVDSETLESCRSEVLDALANGADYDEISDILLGDLGLEMDYVMDIIGM